MSAGALQTAAMATDERRLTNPPAGIVLHAAAINVVRTPVMRLQEPFGAILNVFAPGLKLLPKTPPEKYHRHPEEVQCLLLSHTACS
jgi:hypothetical protein